MLSEKFNRKLELGFKFLLNQLQVNPIALRLLQVPRRGATKFKLILNVLLLNNLQHASCPVHSLNRITISKTTKMLQTTTPLSGRHTTLLKPSPNSRGSNNNSNKCRLRQPLLQHRILTMSSSLGTHTTTENLQHASTMVLGHHLWERQTPTESTQMVLLHLQLHHKPSRQHLRLLLPPRRNMLLAIQASEKCPTCQRG